MKRARLAGILLLSGLAVLSFGDSGKRDVARRRDASEIGTNSKDREFRIFSAPVQIVRGGQRIYVVDSQDGEIRVFSESGDYERTVGRKGQGPGELNSPGGMDVYEKMKKRSMSRTLSTRGFRYLTRPAVIWRA